MGEIIEGPRQAIAAIVATRVSLTPQGGVYSIGARMLNPSSVIVMALCVGLVQGAATNKKVIVPKGAQPSAAWSHGLLVDGTLYVSGMGDEDAAGKIPRPSRPK